MQGTVYIHKVIQRNPPRSGIFQRVMENLLAEITYVIVSLDDILVSAENELEHPRNLKEQLKQV